MKKILFFLAFGLFAFASAVSAQPRPADTAAPSPAVKKDVPETFDVKYEGGMFGFEKKEEGTLKFDDINERIVFYGKDKKEKFAIPYDSMTMVYTGTKSVRSGAGTAVSAIPLPGAGLAGLLKEKRRYLTIHYSDRDVEASGVANFKVEEDGLRNSVVHALGEKAQLKQRGDAYYRPRPQPKTEL